MYASTAGSLVATSLEPPSGVALTAGHGAFYIRLYFILLQLKPPIL